MSDLNKLGLAEARDKLRSGESREICCTSQAMAEFETAREEAAKKTVWFNGGCNSWYLDERGIPASWPWNYSRFVAEMETPVWSHYNCTA